MTKRIDISKSWDKVANSWYRQTEPLFSRGDLLWGPYGPWERDAKLLPPVKSKKALVAGCGSAPDVWWLAKHGAKVVGIDISAKQLELARKRMKKAGFTADFIQQDLDKLSKKQFRKNSFDIIISNYAFQYVRDLPRLFKTLSYFLKDGGKLVFSFDHPVSCAIEKRKRKDGSVKLDVDYLNERTLYWSFSDWKATKRTIPGYSYHRTISSIYSALVNAEFFVQKILELKPTMKSGVGSSRAYKIAKRIPETIIFACIKRSKMMSIWTR